MKKEKLLALTSEAERLANEWLATASAVELNQHALARALFFGASLVARKTILFESFRSPTIEGTLSALREKDLICRSAQSYDTAATEITSRILYELNMRYLQMDSRAYSNDISVRYLNTAFTGLAEW